MNQTTPDTQNIEHLDYRPECDSVFHGTSERPPADLWLEVHNGCHENLFCAPCEARERSIIESGLASGSEMHCKHCGGRVWTYGRAYTRVVPL